MIMYAFGPSFAYSEGFLAFLAPKRSKVRESTTFTYELRASLRLSENTHRADINTTRNAST
jgi:hypothetical protein